MRTDLTPLVISLCLLAVVPIVPAETSVLEIPTAELEVQSIAFSPDGKLLACGGGAIHVYDAHTGALVETIEHPPGGATIYNLAFTADSAALVFTSGKILGVYDRGQHRLRFSVTAPDQLYAMAFSPKTGLVAIKDATVDVYQTQTGKKVFSTGIEPEIQSMAFSPDGKILLVSPTWGSTIMVVETQFGKTTRQLQKLFRAKALAFVPGADQFMFIQDGWKVTLGGLDDFIKKVIPVKGANYAIDVSPDGTTAAIGTWLSSPEESVKLIDLASAKVLKTYGPFQHPVYKVQFSKDGKQLAACFKEGVVRVWQLK